MQFDRAKRFIDEPTCTTIRTTTMVALSQFTGSASSRSAILHWLSLSHKPQGSNSMPQYQLQQITAQQVGVCTSEIASSTGVLIRRLEATFSPAAIVRLIWCDKTASCARVVTPSTAAHCTSVHMSITSFRMLLRIFSTINNRMGINRLLIDNRIFIQHAQPQPPQHNVSGYGSGRRMARLYYGNRPLGWSAGEGVDNVMR